MRREIFKTDAARGRALLARAPFVHMAGVDEGGQPVARTVHGVIVGDKLCFHGAPAGEKLACIGRDVIVWAEEVVAEIPSYFMDPVRACPATTLYESAMVHGKLERLDDVAEKAFALQALMERFQPEGGHRPITAHDEMYRAAVAGILICGVSLAQLDSKTKLGQNRTPAEIASLVDNLWRRGAPGDARAIDLVLDANPAALATSWVGRALQDLGPSKPSLLRLRTALDASYAEEAAALLEGTYWNAGVPAAALAEAHRGSSAWLGAVDDEGHLIASCRAIADGAKWAAVYDVIVREDWRGRGVGNALLRVLLDHPAVRRCRKVFLRTKDAQPVYAKLGFVAGASSQNTEMVLDRGAPWSESWTRTWPSRSAPIRAA